MGKRQRWKRVRGKQPGSFPQQWGLRADPTYKMRRSRQRRGVTSFRMHLPVLCPYKGFPVRGERASGSCSSSGSSPWDLTEMEPLQPLLRPALSRALRLQLRSLCQQALLGATGMNTTSSFLEACQLRSHGRTESRSNVFTRSLLKGVSFQTERNPHRVPGESSLPLAHLCPQTFLALGLVRRQGPPCYFPEPFDHIAARDSGSLHV